MADRIITPFTNEHFIAFCEKMLGQPYWYGCCLYKCKSSLLTSKTRQYPSSYAVSRTARYKQDIAGKKVSADCVGACKGYAWTGGGIGVTESIGTDKAFTNKYGSNGCPDQSANGMFSYAKKKGMEWGKIGTLPEVVGLALHKDGHIGYYAGNGYAIEWKGFNYGCVKTKVAGRGWLDVLGEDKKEDARFVLPNACATRMIVTMNARELLHFFSLRCCNRAQWEIRNLAWEMLRLVAAVAPSLFVNAGPDCVRGACGQGKMSCGKPYGMEGRA